MKEERQRILSMLAEGKVDAAEAERLFEALEKPMAVTKTSPPRYLRVLVKSKKESGENVKVKVPLAIVKAGVRMASLIPKDVHGKVQHSLSDKGIDFDISQVSTENIDEFLSALGELEVEVQNDDEEVHVYCE